MVFIYQMPAANAGRGGGGAGGGGPATGQRTVFRPPWVKDGSEAAAPPPPTGPPWRRQSRAGPAAAEEASGGPSGNSAASNAPAKAPETADKKGKVIPIMRQDNSDGSKGADPAKSKVAPKAADASNAAPAARGKPSESSEKKEKVIPIMRADSKPQDTVDKKAKVIPITRADTKEESPAARNRGNLRSAESSETPQRGRLTRQEKQSEPPERKSSVVSASNRTDGPLENGLSAKDRKQQSQPPQRQQRQDTLQRQVSQQKGAAERGPPGPPPPPPPPPMAPPPPPMPSGDVERLTMTPAQRARLEALKSRPRRRPDWATMMKEVEQGKKLKHVQCNDRSRPLLPQVKAKGQFVYETEQKNIHNQLLNQIQQGVKLKKVVTNDRSRPVLEGLRKFRRQMTIEEQLQKAEEEPEPEPDELDELDDIDKVRDDLQSTKQMLALELQNKTQAERENRLLQARIFALEEQLGKERERARMAEEERDRLKEATDCGIPGIGDPLDSLRAQVALAGKTAYEYQQKYQDACKKLDLAKANMEDEQHKNLMLERRLQAAQDSKGGAVTAVATSTVTVQTDPVVVVGSEVIPLTKQPSRKEIARAVAAAAAALPQNQQQQQNQKGGEENEESEYTEESYTDSEDSESEEAKQERRNAREMKMLASKLRSYREKEGTAKKERKALKEQHERLSKTLNTEKKKYRLLQKEVDKMAKLMKEEEDDDEEEEEEEESEEESEESSEESSEEEEEQIPEDDPKAPPEKKTFRFEQMIKKHENSLAALKKGNYVFKTNIDRIKDELEKQKEMYVNLQEDLNSVLAELG